MNPPDSLKPPAPSRELFYKAMKEGLCLTFFKKGHKSSDCKEKKSHARNEQQKNERINSLYQLNRQLFNE